MHFSIYKCISLILLSFCLSALGCGQARNEEPPPTTSTQELISYAKGKIPSLTSKSLVGFYYGDWDKNMVLDVTGKTGNQKYDLIVLHPKTNISSGTIDELRANGIKVFCYLSVGEDDTLHTSAVTGEISGPANGYATWYYDDNGDTLPDKNGDWESYYVNPGDKNWRNAIKNYRNDVGEGWYGYDYLMNDLHCDGLFLDTIDTYSPKAWGNPYGSEMGTMVDLLEEIRNNIPIDRYIMMNRGLFYFDSEGLDEVTETMRDRVRGLINAVLYEDFLQDPPTQRDYWSAILDKYRNLDDGFTVISLDYLPDPETATDEKILEMCNEIKNVHGWIPVISATPLSTNFWHTVRDHCQNEPAL